MIISTEINERQLQVDDFLKEQFGPDEPVEIKPLGADCFHSCCEIPDDELIQRILQSRQGELFQQLYSADITGYPSASEADLAFNSMTAFWTGKNPEQMDRLFRQSSLMRDKWDEKRGSQTYGQITIEKAIQGCREVYGGNASLGLVKRQEHVDPAKLLESYAVGQEYADRLGKEQFLITDLLIKQHIVTIIAESGGGKTTYFYQYVAPELAKQGFKVWYIDADSPPSEHKGMKAIAVKHGFKFLNPDANQGTSTEGLLITLKDIADAEADLTDWVFIFDTLKKMADLLQKNSVKQFYALCRKLAAKGATIILLGHANKYRDKEGHLIFEGVGDVKSDSDELIIFESRPNQNGGIDVTTVVDPNKGAKVRGIFKPISFHISVERKITFYNAPLQLPDLTTTGTLKATNNEILAATEEYLSEWGVPVKQKELVKHVATVTSSSQGRVRALIIQNSEPIGAAQMKGMRFVYSKGGRNTLYYELPQVGVHSPTSGALSPDDIDTCVEARDPE